MLVLTMWVLVFFSILCAALYGIVSARIGLTKRIEDRIIGKYLAKAAVLCAQRERGASASGYDTLYDLGQERKRELGIGAFRYTLTDEESKININTSPPETFACLPGFDLELAQEVSASSLRPFYAIDEILLVDGVSDDIFKECKDLITVHSDGRVNVNTAPAEVLKAAGLEEYLAEAVVDLRKGPDGKEGTKDDEAFKSASEILEKLRAYRGLSQAQEAYLLQLINQGVLSVGSQNFSMHINADIVKRPAMKYVIVMNKERIRQWREY
jgi:competence protein ComEA